MKRLVRALAVSAAVAGAGIFVTGTPAQAALPSCVYWQGSSSPTSGTIMNTCFSTYRVKVDWGWGAPDSSCYTLQPISHQRVWSRWPTAQFDGLISC